MPVMQRSRAELRQDLEKLVSEFKGEITPGPPPVRREPVKAFDSTAWIEQHLNNHESPLPSRPLSPNKKPPGRMGQERRKMLIEFMTQPEGVTGPELKELLGYKSKWPRPLDYARYCDLDVVKVEKEEGSRAVRYYCRVKPRAFRLPRK
jgi:hypothetical protein